MSLPIQAWYAIGGILSFLVIVLLFFVRVAVAYRVTFQDAAAQLGLAWEAGGPFSPGQVAGAVNGDSLNIRSEKHGAGSFERQYTVVELDLVPPLRAKFEVGHENLFTRLGAAVGVHDIEFDDAPFDKVFRVKADDPQQARAVLGPDARAALVELARGCDDIEVRPERIRWQYSGRVTKAKTLVRVARSAVAAAQAMRRGL